MNRKVIIILILAAFLLSACSWPISVGQSITRVNWIVANSYTLRDINERVVRVEWCFVLDAQCNENPFRYPLPAVRP